MTNKTVKCVGVTYVIAVPSTPEEFDALAKRPGACVDEANNNVIYRGTNPDFRDAYLSALCEKYGYTRPTVDDPMGRKTEDGAVRQVFKNSEAKEINIIIAQFGVSEADQQALADSVMSAVDANGAPLVTFDPAERERKTKEPSVGKQDTEMATTLVNGDAKVLAIAIKNIKKKVGVEITLTGDKDADIKALALGIKAVRTNPLAMLS